MILTSRSFLEQRGRGLAEGVRKSASLLSAASNVFLSHSTQDKGPILWGAIQVLRDHNGVVYADVLDPMTKNLSPADFGAFFAEAIRDTERLIVLLTSNTADSRWVPWELGLAHGVHGVRRVAVWPVADDPASPHRWTTQEYLEAYPRVERVALSGKITWAVRDPTDGKYWPLVGWLRL